MNERTVIGDIDIMFGRRSEFLYRTLSNLDCQAIRKHEFYRIMEKYTEYAMKIKAKAFTKYKDLVRKPILEHKKATYDHIYTLHPLERVPVVNAVNDNSLNDDLIIL